MEQKFFLNENKLVIIKKMNFQWVCNAKKEGKKILIKQVKVLRQNILKNNS